MCIVATIYYAIVVVSYFITWYPLVHFPISVSLFSLLFPWPSLIIPVLSSCPLPLTHPLPPSPCLSPFALDLILPLSCLLPLSTPYPTPPYLSLPSFRLTSLCPSHSLMTQSTSLPPFLTSSPVPPFLIPSPPIPHPHYLPWYPFTYILYWIIYNVFLYFCISSTFPPPSGCCGGWGEVFVTSLVFV